MKMRQGLKFEVHIVEHCNLNCKGCFHFSNIADPEYLNVQEYENDVQRLAELYDGKLELALLLGGEPLLHNEIEKFMAITRTCFPVGKIGLVTNGILLLKMKESFWMACKEYSITLMPTIYPIYIDYGLIEQKAAACGIVIDYFNEKSSKKTLSVLSIDPNGNQNSLDNFNSCYRANFCITLKNGRLYTCLVPAHLHHYFEKFGLDDVDFRNDGIDIYQAKDANEIERFLTMPITACAFCNQNMWRDGLKWERTEGKMEEWQ